MKPTEEQQERLREIMARLVASDHRWLSQHDIVARDKPPYWILNYGDRVRNDFNCLVRGLVARRLPSAPRDSLDHIASFPFIRFFNHGEPHAHPIDFQNADMLEKLDGVMACVFFPDAGGRPCFNTRRMLSTHRADLQERVTGADGREHRLMEVVGSHVEELRFDRSDATRTFIFEFVHAASRVMTRYSPSHYGLYLLGVRDLVTFAEQSEEELDETAARLQCKRPRRWDALASMDEIHAMMKQIEQDLPDFEGFVFRDRGAGARLKLKDPDYLLKHRNLKKLSLKNLVPLVLQGETEEVCAYFPEAQQRMKEIKAAVDEYVEATVATVVHWRNRSIAEGLSRKLLAVEVFGPADQGGVKDKFVQRQIMDFFQDTDDERIRQTIRDRFHKLAREGASQARTVVWQGLQDADAADPGIG